MAQLRNNLQRKREHSRNLIILSALTDDSVGSLGSESQLSEGSSEGTLHLGLVVDETLEGASGR